MILHILLCILILFFPPKQYLMLFPMLLCIFLKPSIRYYLTIPPGHVHLESPLDVYSPVLESGAVDLNLFILLVIQVVSNFLVIINDLSRNIIV